MAGNAGHAWDTASCQSRHWHVLPLMIISSCQVPYLSVLSFSTSTAVQVHIGLHGDHGRTERFVLPSQPGGFKKGSMASFTLDHVPCVGRLKSLTVGTDGRGMFPGWRLKCVSCCWDAVPLSQCVDIAGFSPGKVSEQPEEGRHSSAVVVVLSLVFGLGCEGWDTAAGQGCSNAWELQEFMLWVACACLPD